MTSARTRLFLAEAKSRAFWYCSRASSNFWQRTRAAPKFEWISVESGFEFRRLLVMIDGLVELSAQGQGVCRLLWAFAELGLIFKACR